MVKVEEAVWLDILSTTATISTVIQFLSGIISCRTYIQRKSTGDSSVFPFVCGFMSCSLWLNYGVLINDHTLMLVNIVGSMLFLSYCFVFFIFAAIKRVVVRLLAISFIIVLCLVYYTQVYDRDLNHSVRIMGFICCAVGVLFFAAPLSKLLHVIRVKSTESLPFPLIFTSFFVSLQWYVYGLLKKDQFIQFPNLLGAILSGVQLVLFMIYPRTPSTAAYRPLEQDALLYA